MPEPTGGGPRVCSQLVSQQVSGFLIFLFTSDLEKEQQTSLRIHPFCFMDANSFYEQKNTPEEALQELMQLHDEIDKVNGTMITIWHNSFLGTDQSFTGWREVYEKFIGSVSSHK